MQVEQTKIYAVLKEVFEGTEEWLDIYDNLVAATKTEFFSDYESLSNCFVWSGTKQGNKYWHKIQSKITTYQSIKQQEKENEMKTNETTTEKQEPKLISMDKQYTSNGEKVRILCIDRKCLNYPVIAIINDVEVRYFTKTGEYYYEDNSVYDLKEYNPWSEVEVDTKVIVTFSFDGGEINYKRHFSHYDEKQDCVYVFGDGKTSFTGNPINVVPTVTARLS